jgi:hypothetical protein
MRLSFRSRLFLCSVGVFALAASSSGCDPGAAVVVDDVSATRLPDGRIQVDVQIVGAEQGGGNLGDYCVAAYWFDPLDLGALQPALAYSSVKDSVLRCARDIGELRDGDRIFVRLVSNRTDLSGSPMRTQANVGTEVRTSDGFAP